MGNQACCGTTFCEATGAETRAATAAASSMDESEHVMLVADNTDGRDSPVPLHATKRPGAEDEVKDCGLKAMNNPELPKVGTILEDVAEGAAEDTEDKSPAADAERGGEKTFNAEVREFEVEEQPPEEEAPVKKRLSVQRKATGFIGNEESEAYGRRKSCCVIS